jgi:FMN phosphatase YigB (HAD superfamily)
MIIAFDFDNTITSMDISDIIYNYLQCDFTLNQSIDKLFDICQLKNISSELFNDQGFLAALKTTKTRIAVTSFGYKQVIKAVLNKLNIKVDNIITPLNLNLSEGLDDKIYKNKNSMLQLLQTIYNVHPNGICLIDDLTQNIDAAKEAGYRTYHVTSETGLSLKDYNELISLLKN